MKNESVCPWWMGYVLLNPLRKLGQNPHRILKSMIQEGDHLIDYGCAMGYFSLPMADMAGPSGKVYSLDIQEKMLEKLMQRAEKQGLAARISPILINNNFRIEEMTQIADLALLFAVAHEVPDRKKLFEHLYLMIKPGGKLLFAEPRGHVKLEDFENSVSLAETAGFKIMQIPAIPQSHVVLFQK